MDTSRVTEGNPECPTDSEGAEAFRRAMMKHVKMNFARVWGEFQGHTPEQIEATIAAMEAAGEFDE